MMKEVAIYGAGGFGREIACILHRINKENEPTWNLIGFFDDGLQAGARNEYGAVFGNIETLNDWPTPLCVVFAIGAPHAVKAIFSKISNPLIEFPNIFAPDTLWLDKSSVSLGKGNVFCSQCIVSCNVEIGNFNCFNGLISIGHDAKIGDFNAVMPGVKISGGVEIGEENFLGVNSVVLQYKKIGCNTIVGASSVIMRNTKDGYTYAGNPARKVIY